MEACTCFLLVSAEASRVTDGRILHEIYMILRIEEVLFLMGPPSRRFRVLVKLGWLL